METAPITPITPATSWKERTLGIVLFPIYAAWQIAQYANLQPTWPRKIGMFVTATFHGSKTEKLAAVPASAILHLHDRDWVYVPAGSNDRNAFRRVEVKAGGMLPNNVQEILSGLTPGQQVVTNALELQNTAEQ